MENLFIEIVKQINPVQTVILGLIVFYFYNRQKNETKNEIKDVRTEIKDIRSEIKDLRLEVNTKYDKLNDKYDKLNDLIIDLYKTLFKKDAA